MRLVAWNCAMALHKKRDALLSLAPDVAVVSECASPAKTRQQSRDGWPARDFVWIGRNPHKGLGVLTFNGYRASLSEGFSPAHRFVAPVRIDGALGFNLLAVWAQNLSGGITRKRQFGPLRLALRRHRSFLGEGPSVVAGDLNNNVIWDRPGWRINHAWVVEALAGFGLVSAYHAVTGETQGEEGHPTHYWRDRKKDGPTYHVDYVFIPEAWVLRVVEMTVGSFEAWCGSGLSDHVPLVVEVAL